MIKERHKTQHSMRELNATVELARLDLQIAQSDLNTAQIQGRGGVAPGTPSTPKEELNAHFQERQRYLDFLDAQAQLGKATVSLLRQTGGLDAWVRGSQPVAHP